jgi:hypothetical protein
MLEVPVRFSVGNAEKELAAATQAGSPLMGRSPLVAQIEKIARHIAPAAENPPPQKLRRFFDFFSAIPAAK